MSVEENKVLVRRFLEALDTNDLGALDDVCSADVARDWGDGINAGPWTDHHLEVKQMVAEDNRVMVVLATRGVLSGEFHGIPPTGAPFTNLGAVMFSLDGGKIDEVATFFDDLDIVTRQLGATITPPASNG
jgi:ketosteroid isomerase-like protein